MKEDTGENPNDKLLKDMEEENPEAFKAAKAELAAEFGDIDPHQIQPEKLINIFNKYAAEKETSMMTNRGANPLNYDQKKFNKDFDVTGDGQFDLQDVLELANKSIPYAIYFGAQTGYGIEDKDVTTKNAQIKGLNVPALFKSLSRDRGVVSTAPYLIVYIIQAAGEERYYVFNPKEAFGLSETQLHGLQENKEEWIQSAIVLSTNFIAAPELFTQYSEDLDKEIGSLTKRQFAKSSIKIAIKNTGVDSLLGRMLKSGGIKSEYAYATEIDVKIGGSVGFQERVDELLFALDHLPMLTNVTFTLAGVMTGRQQKILQSLLGEYKPNYSYEIDSAFLEEEKLMEDYDLVKKIKRAKNGR